MSALFCSGRPAGAPVSEDFAAGRRAAVDPRRSAIRKLGDARRRGIGEYLTAAEVVAASQMVAELRLYQQREDADAMGLRLDDSCPATGGEHSYQGHMVGDWEDPAHGGCADCGAAYLAGVWTPAPLTLAPSPATPPAGEGDGAVPSLPGSGTAPTL